MVSGTDVAFWNLVGRVERERKARVRRRIYLWLGAAVVVVTVLQAVSNMYLW